MFRHLLNLFIAAVVLMFIALLIKAVGAVNETNALVIGNSDLQVEIDKSVYVDREKMHSIDTIFDSKLPNVRFEETKNWGFSESRYFYYFKISNKGRSEHSFVLMLDNPMIDSIKVYQKQGDSYSLSVELGDTKQVRTSLSRAMPTYFFEVTPNSSLELVVEAETTGGAFLPSLFFKLKDFERYKSLVLLIWGAFTGVALVMIIFNVILYTGTREPLYVYYIGYVLFFTIELGVMHGFSAFLFPEFIYQFISKNINVLNALISYFTLQFALAFLKFDYHTERLTYVTAQAFSYVLLLFSVLFLFLKESEAAVIFFVLQITTYAFVIVLMYKRFRERLHWTKYYIISWLPLFTGAAIGSMLFMGVLEYEFWTRHAALLGVMIEMSLISLALAERLRLSEQKRLFEASHDPVLKLANSTLLQNRLVEKPQVSSERQHLSLVTIGLNRYEQVSTYFSETDFRLFVHEFLHEIREAIAVDLILMELDEDSLFPQFAVIRDGVFGFIVTSSDSILIANALENVEIGKPVTCNVNNITFSVTYHVGVASANTNTSEQSLISLSLQALETAVSSNKPFVIFTEYDSQAQESKVSLAEQIKGAMSMEQFEVYFQPYFALQNGEMIGIEALLRWRHPKLGLLHPKDFMSIAEDTGMTMQMTEFVIKRSGELLNKLKSQKRGLKVSINLATRDLITKGVGYRFKRIVSDLGLSPSRFEFEIKESAREFDFKVIQPQLIELNKAGFGLALDNFGSGYSAVSFLGDSPISVLKLDRIFVTNIENSPVNQSIVKSALALANELKLTIVAEGIEHQATFEWLKNNGMQFGQGFGLAMPQTQLGIVELIMKAEERRLHGQN